ncbi:unnamed protein product [marine sediment metagenome]|uniref:Uncharacterized protein n=1 Tax=marine sediment metagenome TaxID=412755 RepID=X1GBA8_9ZZZZ
MDKNKKSYKYGAPVDATKASQRRKRRPEYDECLSEFLNSKEKYWKVNIEALPSSKPRVVLSSLKWRIKNKPEFERVKAFMNKSEVYLQRVGEDEK